jgi:beta-lactamase regulating signal transducer with metallopeptidase domain
MTAPDFSWLLALLVKSAVLALLVLVPLYVAHRVSAESRYLILRMTLVALALLPLLSWSLPAWHLPGDWWSMATSLVATGSVVAVGVEQAPAAAKYSFWSMAALGYTGICILFLLRLAIGVGLTHGSLRRCVQVDDAPTVAQLARLSAQIGVVAPELRIDESGAGPYVWGLRKPTVAVPKALLFLKANVRHAVFAHELIHVRRYDALTCMLSRVLCCIYWLNPVVWWLDSKLKLEMEKSCDDRAASFSGSAGDYAERLVDAVKVLNAMRPQQNYVVAMARASTFKRRIEALLNNTHRNAMSKVKTVWVAITIACIGAMLAAARSNSNLVDDAMLAQIRDGAGSCRVTIGEVGMMDGAIRLAGTAISTTNVSCLMRNIDTQRIGDPVLLSVYRQRESYVRFDMRIDKLSNASERRLEKNPKRRSKPDTR